MGGDYYERKPMQKVKLVQTEKNPNFIGAWIIEPTSICDKLINYFESNKSRQKIGVISGGTNLSSKNSIDVTVNPSEVKKPGNEPLGQYMDKLFECYCEYTKDWPFLSEFATNLEIGEFNIQRYQSGQHFQKIHAERTGIGNIHRLFAWMTYLNDVEVQEGGATVFNHFDIKIQPKKGLTLIWPAEWTHAHQGNVLRVNSKYIVTGWMHFTHNAE